MYNRETVCRMVMLYSFISMSDFLALTMWSGRPQKQKECCRTGIILMMKNDGIATRMPNLTRKST